MARIARKRRPHVHRGDRRPARRIYDQIGRSVAYEVKTQEVTALFAGIALLLAIAAAAAGLIWTQRIV